MGLVTDGAALAALIEADPDDEDAYLVYADWLQSQDDPRGELIILEHRFACGEDVARERWRFLQRHRRYLLGHVDHRVDLFEAGPRTLGFLRRIPAHDNLPVWLTVPVARFATAVVLRNHHQVGILQGTAARPPLRDLAIQPTRGRDPVDLSWVWQRFPWLERFELDGNARFGEVSAPKLRELRVGYGAIVVDDQAIAALARSSFPALETLRLGWPGNPSAIAALLSSARLPRLTHLAIHRFTESANQVSSILADSPLLGQLSSLQITTSDDVSSPGRRELVRAADFYYPELDLRFGQHLLEKQFAEGG